MYLESKYLNNMALACACTKWSHSRFVWELLQAWCTYQSKVLCPYLNSMSYIKYTKFIYDKNIHVEFTKIYPQTRYSISQITKYNLDHLCFCLCLFFLTKWQELHNQSLVQGGGDPLHPLVHNVLARTPLPASHTQAHKIGDQQLIKYWHLHTITDEGCFVGWVASGGAPYFCATVECFRASPVWLHMDGNITQAIHCTAVLCSHRPYLMFVK